MKRLLVVSTSVLALMGAGPAGAVFVGVQCLSNCPGGSQQNFATAMNVKAVRIRVPIIYPFIDTSTSPTQTNFYATSAVSAPSNTIYVNSVTGATLGDKFISTAWGLGVVATLTSIGTSPPTMTFDTPTSHYVSEATIPKMYFGLSSQIATAQSLGYNIDMTIFNSTDSTLTDTGPIIDSDEMFEYDVNFTIGLAASTSELGSPPWLISLDNEEDGQDFMGTPAEYVQMLADTVVEGHRNGEKVTNGGITVFGLGLAYWYNHQYIPDYGTSDPTNNDYANQLLAYDYQEGAFSKSASQDNFAGNLPTPCDHSESLSPGKLARVQTVLYLLEYEPGTGIDYVNTHYYQVPPYTYAPAVTYWEGQAGLPVLFNEVGTYSFSAIDVLTALNYIQQLNPPEALWWGGGGGSGVSQQLMTSGGYINPNGQAFASFNLHGGGSQFSPVVPVPPLSCGSIALRARKSG